MHQVQIRLKGQIDPHWSEWLGGLTISHAGKDETLLAGVIPDQPALYGLLSKVRDLGLPLLAVEVGEGGAQGPSGVMEMPVGVAKSGEDLTHPVAALTTSAG